MRYIYQLGEGYVLGVDANSMYKVYTGYPYPKFDTSQDELLYEFYLMYNSPISYDHWFMSKRGQFITDIKLTLSIKDSISINKFFHPDEQGFALIKSYAGCKVYVGAYSYLLDSIPDIIIKERNNIAFLFVPDNLAYKLKDINLSWDIDELDVFNKFESANVLSNLGRLSLPCLPDNIYVLGSSALWGAACIWEDKVNLIASTYNLTLDENILKKSLVPTKLVKDFTESEVRYLYENYIQDIKHRFKTNFNDKLSTFPFSYNNFSVDIKSGTFKIKVFRSSIKVSGDFFTNDLVGKLAPFVKKYDKGAVVFDAKKIWGSDYEFILKLFKTMDYKAFSMSDRLQVLKTFNIPDKVVTKHNLMYGDEGFLSKRLGFNYFNLDNFAEFNLFIGKVELSGRYIKIDLSKLVEFYNEFKSYIKMSFEDFLKDNYDYYTCVVKIISLSPLVPTLLDSDNIKYLYFSTSKALIVDL